MYSNFKIRTKLPDLKLLVLTLLLTGLWNIAAWSQSDYTNISQDWKYDPASRYTLNYRVSRDDSVFHIYFSINLPAGMDIDEEVSLFYEVKSSLEDDEIQLTRTINFPVHGMGADPSSHYFHVEIPDANNYNLFFLNVRNRSSGKTWTQDIPLVAETIYPPPDFMIYNHTVNLPVTTAYAHSYDSLLLRNFDGTGMEYFVYYYNTDFEIADPPMYRLKKEVSRSLNIDSTFTIRQEGAFVLQREGLYFIQSDTSSLSGISIRIENDFYPKMTTMKQLSEPLIYLSTREEIEDLLSSDNTRAAFETFWLNLARTEEGARIIIKDYYDNVEEANQLFTNYKEGWKTDMGMIYIIVGPPDEVYVSEEKESWYYKDPGKNQIVVFNFLKIKNVFSDSHYMLIRDNQYKSFWFKSIDNWRKKF